MVESVGNVTEHLVQLLLPRKKFAVTHAETESLLKSNKFETRMGKTSRTEKTHSTIFQKKLQLSKSLRKTLINSGT